MSFSQLPNETIQLIVDKCAEADRAYNDRKGEQEIKTAGNLGYKQGVAKEDLKGKSCKVLSLVSRAIRSMSVKYVFTSLRTSQTNDISFKYLILGSPLTHGITKLHFEDCQNLLDLVLHVVPQLPNLRSISGLNSNHLRSLCKEPGHFASSSLNRSFSNPVLSLAKKTLLGLAMQITDWSIELQPDNLELLLNENLSGIQHLALSSDLNADHGILDSPHSRYPSILARLPNLRSLTIHQSDTFDDNIVTSIDDSVFETPFSFVHSLRSLELELLVELDMIKTDVKFATLFPSLRRLVLNFQDRGSWWKAEDESFSLPSLEYFEIKNIKLRCISRLLNDLELPSIVEVHLRTVSVKRGEGEAEDEEDEENPPLKPISFLNLGTLRLIKVSTTKNLNRSIISHLSHPSIRLELDFETRLQLDTSCFDIRPSSSSMNSLVPQPLSPFPSPSSSLVESEDPFYEETDRLLGWARAKAESMKSRDLSGSKELLKALKNFKEYVDWSEM
ncbi:hypothetical protein JCM5350_005927 [Sporobolomyces pararoseus]